MAEYDNRDDVNIRKRQREIGATRNETRHEVDHEDVARRAYERFRSRGEEHGRDQEDWFEAERDAQDRR